MLKSVAAGSTAALAGCLGLFEAEQEEEPDNYVNESLQNNDGDTRSENGNGNGEEDLFSVEFLRASETVEIGREETILDTGEEAGLDLPFECRVGRCGECEAHVTGDATEFVDMSDDQTALDDDEIADGSFLTCVSSPTTDFACDERPDADGDPLSEIESGGGAESFDVTYLGAGSGSATIDVGTDETLLDAAKDEDLNPAFRCERGVCGVCESSYDGNANDVVDMEGNKVLDDEEIENGALLTCVSTPKTAFEFEPALDE